MNNTLNACSIQAENGLEIDVNASSEERARELEEQFASENNALPEGFEEIEGHIYYHQPVKGGQKLIYVCSQIEVIACVNKIGWDKSKFVLPSEVIGNEGGEKILFQSSGAFQTNFSVSGTLEEWKSHIGRYCRANSRLLL